MCAVTFESVTCVSEPCVVLLRNLNCALFHPWTEKSWLVLGHFEGRALKVIVVQLEFET